MAETARRRRDPEARRLAIVTAAAELITEIGVDAITHRLVAARAEVPLGATTQYFATLDDLRAAALQLLVEHVDAQMAVVRDTLATQGVSPATLAGLLHANLGDSRALQADRAVVTAAVHDPRLRALARHWSDALVTSLVPTYGEERSRAAAVFVDGTLWHTQIHEQPLPLTTLQHALAAILETPASAASASPTLPN